MNAPRLSPQDMDRLSRLMFAISHNPKTRAAAANLVAQVDPQQARAFSDVFLERRLAQFEKKFADERLKEKIDNVVQARESQKKEIITKRGYSENQVKELEKLQEQYGFSDWEAAADIYATRNPPDDPRLQPPPEYAGAGSTWDFPTVPTHEGKMMDFKDYIKDPRKHSNATAYRMIQDFKRGKLSPAFAG